MPRLADIAVGRLEHEHRGLSRSVLCAVPRVRVLGCCGAVALSTDVAAAPVAAVLAAAAASLAGIAFGGWVGRVGDQETAESGSGGVPVGVVAGLAAASLCPRRCPTRWEHLNRRLNACGCPTRICRVDGGHALARIAPAAAGLPAARGAAQ